MPTEQVRKDTGHLKIPWNAVVPLPIMYNIDETSTKDFILDFEMQYIYEYPLYGVNRENASQTRRRLLSYSIKRIYSGCTSTPTETSDGNSTSRRFTLEPRTLNNVPS